MINLRAISQQIEIQIMMKKEKQLEDFKTTDKTVKRLDQVKGGGGGASSGIKIPPGRLRA